MQNSLEKQRILWHRMAQKRYKATEKGRETLHRELTERKRVRRGL